jgi:hypothetical protein
MIYSQFQKPLLGTPLNLAHPLAKTAGWWLMQEGSGDRLNDLSGNENKGTFVNHTSWKPGRAGWALNFDGTDDYVEVTDSPSLRIANNLTISAWVKLTASPGPVGGAIIQKRSVTIYADSYNYALWLQSTSVIRFEFYDTSYRAFETTDTILVGGWYHIVAVNNEANGTVNIYINGRLSKKAATTYVMPSAGTAPVQIGCYNYIGLAPAKYPFPGIIDDVRIFPRALSAQEVWQLYDTPYAMFERTPSWMRYVAAPSGVLVPGPWQINPYQNPYESGAFR